MSTPDDGSRGRVSLPGLAGRQQATLGFCLLSLLAGCGGEVEGGPAAPNETENPGLGAAPDASAPPSSGRPTGDTVLGPCEKGFDPAAEPTRDCPWLADRSCYTTKVDACACICPRTAQDSYCSSDFYAGPNGRTEVQCF